VIVHTITADQVRAIANSTATSADLQVLTNVQRSKSAAMLALIPRLAAEARHRETTAAEAGWRLLQRVQRAMPSAAESLLRYPSVTAWAADTLRALDSPEPVCAVPGGLALIAAAAAIRGGVPCTIELPAAACADLTAHLPSLGSVMLPAGFQGKAVILRHYGGLTRLSVGSTTVTLPSRLTGPGPNWRPLAAVTTGPSGQRLHVVVDDADPYRLPGYQKWLCRLTPRDGGTWERRIAGGWEFLLAHAHRSAASDVLAMITAIVPLSGADGSVRSVTSRHVCGSIGMSPREDNMAMALTLAHEVQHAKLSALMDLAPLVAEGESGRYYAPWRPDPRPLASLLHGLYAHLAVARFWLRYRQEAEAPDEVYHAHVEFDRWRKACVEVAAVIDSRAELTTCGRVFIDGVAGVLNGWQLEHVPPQAMARADRLLLEHQNAYWGNDSGGTAADRPHKFWRR
jgi:HEXXH motif-containing protein